MQFCYGKKAIDLGCGCGYGTYILSWWARRVVGVDIDPETALWAAQHFKSENLEYISFDITTRWLSGEVYVAFEVLEHLDNPEDVLRQAVGSPLVWSIPVADKSIFHTRRYSVQDIEKLMGRGGWFQSADGAIVPREQAWFDPRYVLGVRHV